MNPVAGCRDSTDTFPSSTRLFAQHDLPHPLPLFSNPPLRGLGLGGLGSLPEDVSGDDPRRYGRKPGLLCSQKCAINSLYRPFEHAHANQNILVSLTAKKLTEDENFNKIQNQLGGELGGVFDKSGPGGRLGSVLNKSL